MVNYKSNLDGVFAALADPTRRGILQRLGGRERTVSQIATPLPISLPAVSRHLRVLEGAGLIARRREGRTHHIRGRPEAFVVAAEWIARHERFWQGQLASLDRYLSQPPPEEPEE